MTLPVKRTTSRCSTFQMEIAGSEPALQDLARRGADHATNVRVKCAASENPAA